ncbi:MAG: ABC transporter ATP-binding protein [Bacteroidia bacterium]|nr:MAG: ABC transporter ATP-binding protein [Bacteroidia bacterium]
MIIQNLCFCINNKYILNNTSFTIKKGERVAIIGLNGSGKTTLFKCISGLITNYKGEITDNQNVGYLFDELQLPSYLKVKDFYALHDIKKNELTESFIRFEDFKNKYFNNLSLGYKKRLAFLGLLNKEILLLDEPFNGLDFESLDILLSYIKNDLNKTYLISTHQVLHIEQICTHVIFMKNGKASEKFEIGEVINQYKDLKNAAKDIYKELE